jgi:glycosyltransferase involved in cell wall biosynthesis
MNSTFKFTIAIPTFNNSKFLEKQFDLIFEDLKKIKLKNFLEVVVSNNSSNDKTEHVVEKFRSKIKHLDSIKLTYNKNKTNIGYSKNFLKLTVFLNGEYVIFLGDDDLPEKNFYINIYNKCRFIKSKKLFFFPINGIKSYNKSFLQLKDFSHVNLRGGCLSGVMLKKSELNTKNINKNNLYIQTFIYNNCFIKNGFEEIEFDKKIERNEPTKNIYDKFNDKMNRKVDFAFNDKIENIIYFYKQKKINFIKFFISMTYAYDWALKIKLTLIKEKKINLSNIFFENITTRYKFFLILILFTIYFKNFFNRENSFYFNCLKKIIIKRVFYKTLLSQSSIKLVNSTSEPIKPW